MEPKIRFKGYSGDWKNDVIGNIATFSKGRGYSKGDLKSVGNPIILYGRLYTNYSSIINNVDTFASLKKGSVLSKGKEVIIPGSGETPEDIAIASAVEQKDVILGGDLNVITFDEKKIIPPFAAMCITNSKTHYELSGYAQGKTVVHLHNSGISKGHLSYPSKDEQQAIVLYLSSLDKLIKSTSKKVESLKKLKSASLVAMFPQQGETTPKVRFKGFEGEWKTPSIGYVFELRNGYTPSKIVKEFWEGGTIPWFRMEDIRMNGGFLKDALQHITPWAVKGAGLFEKNSIILATTATIGVHAMLIADSQANQRFTNFKVRKSLSDEYIDEFIYYSFFKIDEWSKNNTNSGGLLSVNMPLLVKQSFLTPCKEEQQAIATFFRSLDRKIALETARLEKLKQIKLACLDKMFV